MTSPINPVLPGKASGELLPCPFCNSTSVDPEGWMSCEPDGSNKKTGPACDECGGSTDSVERWNTRLAAQSAAPGGEPVAWPNGSNETVPQALRYLAKHERPIYGQQKFNAEHLYQLAGEIEQMASRQLYTAQPHADGVRAATIAECMEKIGNLRQSEAGLFDPAHSGQRGHDRSTALYDAYQLLRALSDGKKPAGEAQGVGAQDSEAWLILKRGLYFRPNCSGYTGIRDEAGRYSHEFAKKYERDECSIMPLASAPEFLPVAYNDLVIAHLTKQRDELRAALSVKPGAEVGREVIAVPKAALDWLFGEGRDQDGAFFGENAADFAPLAGKYPRQYWWRSKFRSMIPALTRPNRSAGDTASPSQDRGTS